MEKPHQTVAVHTLRTARLSVLVAALSMVSIGIGIGSGTAAGWNSLFCGIVVGLDGVVLIKAREVLALTARPEVRPWMRPVAYVMWGAGAIVCAVSVAAIIRLAAT